MVALSKNCQVGRLFHFRPEMSSLAKLVSSAKQLISQTKELPGLGVQQVRNKWRGWMMIRDVKRRRMNIEHYDERMRLNCLQKNRILPIELREMAKKEIRAFPLNSTPLRINRRCVLTSRPRGIIHPWRLSRIMFRHLVDYNKMSGIQRAMWGFTVSTV